MSSQQHAFSVNERLKVYLNDPDMFVIDIPSDTELYKYALNKKMSQLLVKFAKAFRKSSTEDKVAFFNSIPLSTENYNNDILDHLFDDVLTWSSTCVIQNIKIDRSASKKHCCVANYRDDILTLRNDMIPIDKSYDAPHVVLTFDLNGTFLNFVKYFNGVRWCNLQMNDRLLTSLPFLETDKYAVLDNELWYIAYDTYLCRVPLFNNERVIRFPLPKQMPKKFQLCSDGKKIVLVSKHMQICEVSHDPHNRNEVVIKQWYFARPNERLVVDSNDDFLLLDLYLREADTKMRVVFLKTDNIFVVLKKGIIYEYNVAAHQLFKQTCKLKKYERFVIPKDMKENEYARVLLPTELLSQYLSRFCETGPDHIKSRKKRRLTEDTVTEINLQLQKMSLV